MSNGSSSLYFQPGRNGLSFRTFCKMLFIFKVGILELKSMYVNNNSLIKLIISDHCMPNDIKEKYSTNQLKLVISRIQCFCSIVCSSVLQKTRRLRTWPIQPSYNSEHPKIKHLATNLRMYLNHKRRCILHSPVWSGGSAIR